MQPTLAPYPLPRRRGWGLLVVVLLHLLLLWLLQSGMGRTVTRQAQVVIDAVLLRDEALQSAAMPIPSKPTQAAPQPLTPQPLTPQPVPLVPAVPSSIVQAPTTSPSLPSNAVAVGTAPPSASQAAATSAAAAATAANAPSGREPVRTAAGLQGVPCEKPEYPSASRRLEEEGVVQLRFLVGVDGQVMQSEVVKSSGYKRLDEAARVGLARCQFRPATVDGKPEQAWAHMNYVWRMD